MASPASQPIVLEGFAPNLNKQLHIGHLKNLAAANALSRILQPCQPTAMLGASLGIIPGALEALHALFDFVGYHPRICFDTDLSPKSVPTTSGAGQQSGCQVWQGPLGPVIVIKANGQPTYACHDLAYAQAVQPDCYITGCEQQEHFAALGLASKHLPIGLVLGPDGKKIRSSAGDPFLASAAFDAVIAQLAPTPEPRKLAWNILAFNFLQAALASSNKFDPVQMTKPTAAGMYVSYTLAKVHSALVKGGVGRTLDGPPPCLTAGDVQLLGLAAYSAFFLRKAAAAKDPAPLANYLLSLAKGLAKVYAQQSIKNGAAGLQFAVGQAFQTLERGMIALGLFPLLEV